MANQPQKKGSGSGLSVGKYPIATSFALLVLAALVVLIVLRHLMGSITIQVGTS